MHGALGMAKKPPPPPPPPPKKVKKAPPPPPKKAPPPKKKAPSPPPSKKSPPKKGPKSKARPKKGRKIKIKLGLRQNRIREESDEVVAEDIGWTMSQETLEEFEEPESTEPEVISHQCTMCGSVMQIPAPKRDRYEVHCAYPECGHVDKFGI